MIDDGFGVGVVSRTTVYLWYKQFKGHRQSLKDDERMGWPSTVVTDENKSRVCALQMKDHRVPIQILAEGLNMGKDSLATVLKKKMHHRKVFFQFVPHLLTPEQEQHRVDCCQNFIVTCDVDPNFLTSIVTRDESWCFQ